MGVGGCNILPTEGWTPGGYGGEPPGSHPSNLNTQSPPNSLVQTLWAQHLPGWQSQHVIVYRRFIVKNWKQPRYPSTDWTNCGTSIRENAIQQWKWTNCWYTQQSQWISRELYWMKKPNQRSYILYDSTHITYFKWQSIEMENRLVVAWCWGWGR